MITKKEFSASDAAQVVLYAKGMIILINRGLNKE